MKGLPLLFSMMLANSGRGNKLLPHQVYEFVGLYIRQGFSPLQYYSYGWCRKGGNMANSRGYLSRRTYRAMQDRLNRKEWEAIADKKWLFYSHMRLMGLPVPACHGAGRSGPAQGRERILVTGRSGGTLQSQHQVRSSSKLITAGTSGVYTGGTCSLKSVGSLPTCGRL